MKGIIYLFIFLFSIQTQASGGFSVSKTRVIFPSNKDSLGLTVNNNSDSNISLLRSWISKDTKGESDESVFAITPPLYRLEPNSKMQLRINLIDDSHLPKDRESIFYINILAIPPIEEQSEIDVNGISSGVQIAINQKMKLFYRPKSIDNEERVQESSKGLIFKNKNGTMLIENPSPYYITLSDLTINEKKHKNDINIMLSPYESLNLDIKTKKGDKVTYKTINDYGGITDGNVIQI
ncbi:TPA: fimbrial biogenesis chaperone [Providencia alcalifaciens]